MVKLWVYILRILEEINHVIMGITLYVPVNLGDTARSFAEGTQVLSSTDWKEEEIGTCGVSCNGLVVFFFRPHWHNFLCLVDSLNAFDNDRLFIHWISGDWNILEILTIVWSWSVVSYQIMCQLVWGQLLQGGLSESKTMSSLINQPMYT